MFRDFIYVVLGAASVYLLFGLAIAQQPPPPPNPPTPVVAGIVAGAPVTGCAAQAVLFVKSTLGLGCNAGFAENDAGTQVIVPNGTADTLNGGGLNFANGFGLVAASTGSLDFVSQGSSVPFISTSRAHNGDVDISSIGCFGISSTSNSENASDIGSCREAAGVLGISTGSSTSCTATPANCRELLARSYIYGGAVPAVGGSCGSFGTPVGGNTNGTISSTAVCAAASTITLTFAFTAPNGWNCQITDRTTSTAVIRETSATQTVVTFTVGVATAANDVLQFGPCGAY